MRVRITGRVQGVGFRAWTQRHARRLNLSGWVRNEPDGSVTTLLAGADGAVAAMIECLWDGPPGAAVAGVETADETAVDRPDHFVVVRV